MHYYQFHIGDYKSHTHHLSLMEDLAYRRLLDFYFLHEQPIKHRDIARQIGMREHEEDVMTVLNEFFISTADGFVSPRADKEIKQYKEFAEAGKRGAAKRWGTPPNGEANSPPNATPIATNNHKPITNNQIREKATSVATPIGVSDSVWQEFKTLRKAKKAPITQRAIDAIETEANKAGWTLEKALEECVVRGWQAFKADWVAKKGNPADNIRLTVPASNEPDPALEKIKQDQKITRPPTPEEREILNSYRRKA
jgi:uncharacterized protein YdaU (DUF1376 family)